MAEGAPPRRPWRRSLAARQAGLAVAVGFAVGLAISAYQILADFAGEEARIAVTLRQIVRVVEAPAVRAAYELDHRLAERVAEGLLRFGGIQRVRILDELEGVLAERARESATGPTARLARWAFGDDVVLHWTLSEPRRQVVVGEIEVTADTASFGREFLDRAFLIAVGGLVRNVALAVILSLAFYLTTTRALKALERTVSAVDPERPAGAALVPPPGHEHDELGRLGRSIANLLGALHDTLAARERASQALRESEQRFRDVSAAATDWIWEMDAGLRFTHLSPRFGEISGIDPGALLGRRRSDLVIPGEDDSAWRAHLEDLRARRPFRDFRYDLRGADGRLLRVSVSGVPLFDEAGRFTGYRGTGTDITRIQDLTEQLAYQASHDPLTGLINRREFERRVEAALARARADGVAHALGYFDLDQFKVVNDTCGHVAGDELLRQLSAVLLGCIRRGDTLARLGGDEFGLLIESCPLERAREICAGMLRSVEKFRFFWEGNVFSVGISVGLVPVDAASADLGALLGAADSACYAAKEGGRNRVSVYAAEDVAFAQRRRELEWVGRLHRALEEDRLCLFAQPILPAAGHGAPHHELLLRMLDEDGAPLPPGPLLRAAERYQLAARVDRWVLDRALETLARIPESASPGSRWSVNLSGQTLADEGFADYVLERLAGGPVDPGRLCFEVTETAAISNLGRARALMRQLRERGCAFALDDFGSGLSSFAYLRNLPVDVVKIDGMFVRNAASDPVDLAMIRSIHEVARLMGKTTVAEWVEDADTAARLRALGIDYLQGYWVGRPSRFEPAGVASRAAGAGS